jgi:purine nucleoside phosphorylase
MKLIKIIPPINKANNFNPEEKVLKKLRVKIIILLNTAGGLLLKK